MIAKFCNLILIIKSHDNDEGFWVIVKQQCPGSMYPPLLYNIFLTQNSILSQNKDIIFPNSAINKSN